MVVEVGVDSSKMCLSSKAFLGGGGVDVRYTIEAFVSSSSSLVATSPVTASSVIVVRRTASEVRSIVLLWARLVTEWVLPLRYRR